MSVRYLVGVSMCERRVVLAGAVRGPVFVHSGRGRGLVQQTALWRVERETNTMSTESLSTISIAEL